MTEIQPYTDGDLANRIVLLKTLLDLLTAEFRDAKELAAQRYLKGASIPARTDTDLKLGKVSKSDPKPTVTVVDEQVFDAWIRAEYPDKLHMDVEITDLAQVLAILVELDRHDLIKQSYVVPEWLRSNMLAAALTGREIPGLTVTRPAGVVSATSGPAAEQLVRRLLSGSPVQLLRGIEA